MIVLDTLRADHLGAYGFEAPTSPNLDRLAREGTLFREARSTSSWTKPAMASLFSGFDPSVHGVEKGSAGELRSGRVDALSDEYETLAEMFHAQGYATLGWTANPHVAFRTGLDQGFDWLKRSDNHGDRLTSEFLSWLNLPTTHDVEEALALSRGESNALRGWIGLKVDVPVGLVSERVRDRRVPRGVLRLERPEDAPRGKNLRVELGSFTPKVSGRHVLGVVYRRTGRFALFVQQDGGRLGGLTFPERGEPTVSQHAIELTEGVETELNLWVDFGRDPGSFELYGAFLLPAAEIPQAEKWFAYLHYMQTHLPYPAGPSWVEMFAPDAAQPMRRIPEDVLGDLGGVTPTTSRDLRTYLAKYHGAIRETDDQIGRIVEQLRRRGLLEDTLIVVTSDHGEEFLDHGRLNHARTLYSEMLRVPLIFHGAGTPAGRTVDAPVSVTDVYPTLASLFGVVDGEPRTGRDVLASSLPEIPLHFTHTPMQADLTGRWDVWLDGRWKLIRQKRHEGPTTVRLFDLKDDPGETQNLVAEHPQIVERMTAEMDAEIANRTQLRGELERPPRRTTIPEEDRKKLKSLGYLD